jgi:hypothetical protein
LGTTWIFSVSQNDKANSSPLVLTTSNDSKTKPFKAKSAISWLPPSTCEQPLLAWLESQEEEKPETWRKC